MESTNIYLSIKDWVTVNMPQIPFYVSIGVVVLLFVLWILHKIKIKRMDNELNFHVRNSGNIKYCAACRVFMEKTHEEAIYDEDFNYYKYTLKVYTCPKCKDSRNYHFQ